MASVRQQRHVLYSLTALQIGDMQSYVSKLYLHVGNEKLVFFVDNGPWSSERSLRSKPVELWQLMVTQSRISPFANHSMRCPLEDRIEKYSEQDSNTNTDNVSSSERWSSKRRLFHKNQSHLVKFFHDLFRAPLKSVVHMQELSRLLYGCVTFELEWKNIRGINYVNELQTDTYVALELKLLVKRDFCDLKEATTFYGVDHPDLEASWTSLTATPSPLKKLLLKESWESSLFGAEEDVSSGVSSSDFSIREPNILHEVSDTDVELYDAVCHFDRAASFELESCTCGTVEKHDMLMDKGCSSQFHDAVQGSCHLEAPSEGITTKPNDNLSHLLSEGGECSGNLGSATDHSSDTSDIASLSSLQDGIEEEQLIIYSDTLLIYRFCDPILPFELKDIITADQRLLKMLESGLPSWAIFLQSYPVFRRLYRPWMRPLARTLYVLVSIVTVIIGFYDLYKNVPVLKATAARICGPFFEWIEAWEMVSRVKYLGTVLFLQNWEKAFRWLLLVVSTIRKLSNLLFQPLIEPLEGLAEFVGPVWNFIEDSICSLTRLLWIVCVSVSEYTNFILQMIVLPLIWLLTAVSSLVTWILYPIFYALWGFLILPIRLTMLLVDLTVAVLCSIWKAFQNIWFIINSTSKLLSVAGPHTGKAANTSASTLRLLWNDIFSQVFRAVRSIVNVFVAFLTTCNRHRLSIYKHTEAFFMQSRDLMKSTSWKVSYPRLRAEDTSGFEAQGHKRSSTGSAVSAPSKKSRKRVCLAGSTGF